MTDPAKDLNPFDLMEEWKGQDTSEDVEYVRKLIEELRPAAQPLATALAQAAAWQARAEGLEGALRGMEGAFRDAVDIAVDAIRNGASGHDAAKSLAEHVRGRCESANEALSSPRPEPSRVLEVARAVLKYREEKVVAIYGVADHGIMEAIDALTPEERAAIAGEDHGR